MNIEELCKFLVRAKANTYASGKEGTVLSDGSKELIFEEGKFRYKDRYFGENPFIGEEVVFYQGKCVWGMNYFGCIVFSEDVSPKEVYKFLREALKRLGEKKPFRGPDKYEENSFKYSDKVEGDVDRFNGIEKIFYEGIEVYTLSYHGGIVEGET
jgi:hypothetical protein